MKKVAYLTMDDMGDVVTDFHLSFEPMARLGWRVETVAWRGDWVRGDDGRYLLMELKLIEPSLYLRTDRGAATRFASAFDERFQVLTRK